MPNSDSSVQWQNPPPYVASENQQKVWKFLVGWRQRTKGWPLERVVDLLCDTDHAVEIIKKWLS